MNTYEIIFFVWPYHGVERAPSSFNEGNQSIRNPSVKIKADDFAAAFATANHILTGIRMDGRVWQAGVDKIEKVAS